MEVKMSDYSSPGAKRRHERSTVVQPRETAYGGYEGQGTKLCDCRGYVLGIFIGSNLVRIELHHIRNGQCVPRVEPLHLRDWLGTLGPVKLSKAVLQTYGAETDTAGRSRAPSRLRRDRTADGRERR
jgi:hypothetical protein